MTMAHSMMLSAMIPVALNMERAWQDMIRQLAPTDERPLRGGCLRYFDTLWFRWVTVWPKDPMYSTVTFIATEFYREPRNGYRGGWYAMSDASAEHAEQQATAAQTP